MPSRFYVFTEFDNAKVGSYRDWLERVYNTGEFTYIIAQKERCPDTERDHIQGYVILKKRRRIGGTKTALDSTTVHLEKRRGNHQQAVAYCQKEESRCEPGIELGEFSDRGPQSAKFDEIKAAIMAGDTERDLADNHFGTWCRYYRAFREYRMLISPKRDFKTDVRVYWGRSGVGKSRRAEHDTGGLAYRKPLGEWWDGYDGVSPVIIDDFYGWIRFDELLRCLDRYSHRVPVKGAYVNFCPVTIIITSNVQPREWYSVETINDYRFEALTRRLDTVEEMTDQWEPPE